MDTHITVRSFIPYPTNRVVGSIAGARHAEAALSALMEAGVDQRAIDVLYGEEDLRRLAPTGAGHGVLERLQRAMIRTLSPVEEHKHLMDHVQDIRDGRFVLMIFAPAREGRTVVADILNAHGAESVGFYGRWAWQGLTPQ